MAVLKLSMPNGDYIINMSNYPWGLLQNMLVLALKVNSKTGSLKHDYVVNVDKHWYEGFGGNVPTWGTMVALLQRVIFILMP